MEIPTDWTFKTLAVAEGFDRHVREQLPWYDLMTAAVAHIARHYIPQDGVVLDLGCSTGNIGRLLADTIRARHVDFIPIDNSEEMIKLYQGPGSPRLQDIGSDLGVLQHFDVAICFLSLMFVAPVGREKLLSALKMRVNSGGAIIIVDKFESDGGYLGTVLGRLTLAGKVATGCPAEEIIQKELSLSGVQRPMKRKSLEGYREIFRFGDFSGFIFEAP